MLVLNGTGSLISLKIGCLMGLALVSYIELDEVRKSILEARYLHGTALNNVLQLCTISSHNFRHVQKNCGYETDVEVGAQYDSREVFAGSRSCSCSSRFATLGSQSHYHLGRLRNIQGYSMNGVGKTTPKFFGQGICESKISIQ